MTPRPDMLLRDSAASMQQLALEWRAARLRVGLVPTMGYLHEGHASLMRLIRDRCDRLVVSIYVNPAQFGQGEDFEAYPRNKEGDLAICRREAVDCVFMPDNLYVTDASVMVHEKALSMGLCGRSRPGHFEGVATVVVKLFNIVQPHLAVFGQKDAQQLRVLRRVVRDLNLPVDMVAAPIVREPDGLAMSSRNVYLNASERASALVLSRALREVEARFHQARERNAVVLKRHIADLLQADPAIRIDYVEIVEDETLLPVEIIREPALVAVAVKIGKTRLIDNVVLNDFRS